MTAQSPASDTDGADLPSWEQFMVFVLRVLDGGEELPARTIKVRVRDLASLDDAQRTVLMESGYNLSENRIGWAISYLTMATALARPRRAHYVITDLGRELLDRNPSRITEQHLREVPAYRERRARGVGARMSSLPGVTSGDIIESARPTLDPMEQIDHGIRRVNAAVAVDLLDRLRSQDPAFLEQSVLDVLVAMGYGGPTGEARRIGGTGDGGVDGVIDQDKLGLQRIYVQAKRYAADNAVGREAIQAFVGALHGRNVTNGIFITTSRFSAGAIEYANSIGTRVVLIDGPRLAELMIIHGVGVQTRNTYRVVELDEDYFE